MTDLFDHSIAFDPAGDFASFLKQVPAKWAVYLMCDADDQPVQLLCVKNLRYSLERRLGTGEQAGPTKFTKRVDYRDLVRKVYWRRVDSAFEADLIYLECARNVFPESYRGMVGFRPAWFVHVDPKSSFPRYTKTIDVLDKRGLYIGPIEDKHAAQRLIQLAEDQFELCREDFYPRLLEAPHGRACAYKEMGRCPAPCDGSISMEQYRQTIAISAQALTDPASSILQQTQRMNQAAAALRFEEAAKLKSSIDPLSQLGNGPFRHVRRLEDFSFISLQRGPKAGTAKLFLITPAQVEELADLIAEPTAPADLLRTILSRAQARSGEPLDARGVECLGVVAHHLFAPKARQGLFLPLDTIDEKSLAKAFRDVQKQKPDEPTDGEGVMKELQAM